MRKISLLMMAMAAMPALAGTCHWTGAGGDGYWTNSANRAENRIPGRWLVADAEQQGGVATNGVTGEVAIFGDDLVAGGATTIDFSGVHSISNLITTGTSHLTLAGLAVRHGPCLHGQGHHAPFPLIPSKKGSHNDNDLPKV